MKIIIDTDLKTDNVSSLIASNENALFPVENLQNDYTTDLFKAETTSVKLSFAVSKGSAIEILNTNATTATVLVGTGGAYVNETDYSFEAGYSNQSDGSAETIITTLPGTGGRLWADYTAKTVPHTISVTLTGSSVITAGIARAGNVEAFKNPKYGQSEGSDDTSIEKELNNGADYFRLRNVRRTFSGLQILETRANAWKFKHLIWDAVGPEPLAVKLNGDSASDDEFVLFAKRENVKLLHITADYTLVTFGLKETI